ncbi:TPA: toxin-antitoxin system HicB family antitoxin [Serratia marcescens]
MRDAEEYTISIRLESIEGERLYVARVDELPDVEEYADSYAFAHELVLDTIRTTQKIFERKGMTMPEPKAFVQPSASGRVTLRLPRSVHAKCTKEAEKEGVSLNSYLISRISEFSVATSHSEIRSLMESMTATLTEMRAEMAIKSTEYTVIGHEHSLARSFSKTVRLPIHKEDEEFNIREGFKFSTSPDWGKMARC